MQEALKRLPEKELFDRQFRLTRAVYLNMKHDVLPAAEHTKEEQVHLIDDLLGCSIFMEVHNGGEIRNR